MGRAIIVTVLRWSTVVFLLGASLSAFAALAPESTRIRAKTFRHPDLDIGQPYRSAAQDALRDWRGSLAKLQVAPEAAFLDLRGGRWGTLLPSTPLLPGRGVNNSLEWRELGFSGVPESLALHQQLAWEAFAGYLVAHREDLNIDLAELQNPGTVTLHSGGEVVQIHAQRRVAGVPVRGAFVTAVLNRGNLILFGIRGWGDVETSAQATFTLETARSKVARYLGESLAPEVHWGRGQLLYLPMAAGRETRPLDVGKGYRHRLAWALEVRYDPEPLANFEALVDAHSGELLAFEDQSHYASVRQLVGGHLPISNDGTSPGGVEVTAPVPFADITVAGTTYFSDPGGNVPVCLEGEMSTTLRGRYLTMTDVCGTLEEIDPGPLHDLGISSGTDCSTPAGSDSPGNTRAARTAYHEMNHMVAMAQAQLPGNTWLRKPVPATVNALFSCGASGSVGGFIFARAGSGCANTGELAAVVDHEWGHGMDGADAAPGGSNPAEGIADLYASLRLNTSCIGDGFFAAPCSGYGDPCLECTGVREIDWANRQSGLPHDLAWIDANCGSGPAPCGGIVHCEGAVVAESVWDLWNRDLTAPPFSMSLDTARELATQLTFQGAGAVGTWFSCLAGTQTGDGCNADGGYLNYLAIDDDDGTLANGTPHMQAIFNAFERHGIACAAPSVTNTGCGGTPTMAPQVTAMGLDRATLLTWDAVAGATSYRIYRTEGVFACDLGKVLVGETTGLSFTDTGLGNNHQVYYLVVPMGPGASCFGPASSCTAVTPTPGANLAVDGSAPVLTINSGDGDAYLDNCEQAQLEFSVFNVGAGAVTKVRIASARSLSHPGIDTTIGFTPALAASLAECDSATGTLAFEGVDLEFRDNLVFEVCVTSAELAPEVRCGEVSVGEVESNDQVLASKTFGFEAGAEGWGVARGTFELTSGSADAGSFALRSSSHLDNQCDEIRSPHVELSATSTLTLASHFEIEGAAGNSWYDRANLAVIAEGGSRTVIDPTSGRMYNADSAGTGNFSGCNDAEHGWAGTQDTWATSSWDSGVFNNTAFPGKVQLSVTYSTDESSSGEGFWFDSVTVTEFTLQVEDDQFDCVLGPIFLDGFESGDLSAWSSSSP